ncbi:hypothetical protein XELAEV_18001892mg [Xenopus laevis]|uniref:Uncharacterized protein n=1 Tax=Xenopus laevis TaxID=8355 RepID=A0A974BNS3_XENLA|nr:hypothetical protein XELAEV_18001892mg [Xenopus laevis]
MFSNSNSQWKPGIIRGLWDTGSIGNRVQLESHHCLKEELENNREKKSEGNKKKGQWAVKIPLVSMRGQGL